MVSNNTLIYKKVPLDIPVPGEDLVIEELPFDLDAVPLNGLIVEVLSASLDPYLRIRMRDTKVPDFAPPFNSNEPIVNGTISRVIKSDNEDFKVGDLVQTHLPFAQYAAISAEQAPSAVKVNNPFNLPPDVFLGPLGMPGLTGYSSLYEIAKPKKGETIFVSSAAGAVGSIVVIGSVGSDDKLEFILKDLGFDDGFNYKKEKPMDAVARLVPEGLDIYYENVGGAHMEAALAHMKTRGRIVVCGMIGSYNTPLEQREPVRNLIETFERRITIRGFVVSDEDFGRKYSKEHQTNVQKWIAEGSFTAKLHVTHGLEHAAEGFAEIFRGKNFGKAVLKIKE
ncbi:hypothetical protein F5Y15DRAFT_429340 [Xylariaceae sp. FL0016]|nr:hypothetical protein F5Y15DRAFT_429340 [Xylariaceae sp. FL0016]